MEINYESICLRIKETREDKRLTQKAFAQEIGIKQGFVSAIEKGKKPSLETIVKIASVFELDLNWLITGIKSPVLSYKTNEQNVLSIDDEETRDLKKALHIAKEREMDLRAHISDLRGYVESLKADKEFIKKLVPRQA